MDHRTPLDVYWPSSLGSITSYRMEESPYLVYKIEDAHYDIDVRPGMLDLLRKLTEEYDVELACLEGAVGEIRDTSYDFEELQRQFDSGRISAPVFLAMTGDRPLVAYGVEEPEEHLYERNKDALGRATAAAQQIEAAFEVVFRQLERQRAAEFNPELLAFDQAIRDYEAGRLPLQEFIVEALTATAGSKLDTYPRLRAFMGCIEIERSLDFGAVVEDRSRLLRHLLSVIGAPTAQREIVERVARASYKVRGLDPAGATDIAEEYRAFCDQILPRLVATAESVQREAIAVEDIIGTLLDLASLYGLDCRRYANLVRYGQYVMQANMLPRMELLGEIWDATEMVLDDLATSHDEKELIRVSHAADTLYKLCRIKATPRDEARLREDWGRLSVSELMRLVGMKTAAGDNVDDVAMAAWEFYDVAARRGRVIAHNTLRQLRDRRLSQTVLVTGGFLSEYVLHELQQERVSYVVMIPRSVEGGPTFDEYLNFVR